MGNCSSGSKVVTHEIVLTTGDKKGAGATDVDVFLTFTDDQGKNSPEIKVTNFWKNDFVKGKSQKFGLGLENLGKIVDIRIRRDETGKDDVWFVEKMVITSGKVKSVFPIHRWIHANSTLSIAEYDSVLPQFSKHKQQREDELSWKRTEYMLQASAIGVPPQAWEVPDNEEFSTKYMMDNIGTYIEAKANAALIDISTKDFHSLSDFDNIYKGVFNVPKGRKDWKDDESFGNQRLSGVNPVVLELVQRIPAHLAVTAELVEPHLEGKELSDCLRRKKIYLVEHRYLVDIEYAKNAKVPGPTALFYVKDSGALVPIAIQLMPEPGEDNPVFTPSDPEYTWIAAKMWFNLADACHHQTSTHFTATHLMMDSVAVCANRQLSPSHPVFKLLAPHFYHVIAINKAANETLLNPGGWVDKVMMVGRSGFLNLMKENWKDYDIVQRGNLLKSMKRRGVDDPELLPNYHFRDDATLLWNSIQNYVSTVISNVYNTAKLIAEDTELQDWLRGLTSEANFKGLPKTFSTKEEVTEVVTIFIFSSSVLHAAVNFEQYEQYAFPPYYPAWLRGTWPTSKAALTEEDIIKSLPTKDQTIDIMVMSYILSDRGTNALGNYEVEYAYDPVSQAALRKFRAELKEISAVIEKRNGSRRFRYPYINPKEVPNSISI